MGKLVNYESSGFDVSTRYQALPAELRKPYQEALPPIFASHNYEAEPWNQLILLGN